jgi:hypothetical protein
VYNYNNIPHLPVTSDHRKIHLVVNAVVNPTVPEQVQTAGSIGGLLFRRYSRAGTCPDQTRILLQSFLVTTSTRTLTFLACRTLEARYCTLTSK